MKLTQEQYYNIVKLMIIPLSLAIIGYFIFFTAHEAKDVSIDLMMDEEVKQSVLSLVEFQENMWCGNITIEVETENVCCSQQGNIINCKNCYLQISKEDLK